MPNFLIDTLTRLRILPKPRDAEQCGHPCTGYFELGSCRCTGYRNVFDEANAGLPALAREVWLDDADDEEED